MTTRRQQRTGLAAKVVAMNYTNSSARGHVSHELSDASADTVLSLEMTKRGWRLCVRKPATLSRRMHGRRDRTTGQV